MPHLVFQFTLCMFFAHNIDKTALKDIWDWTRDLDLKNVQIYF